MLQYQDQSLRPMTTAHLAQTMSLLLLSNLELREKVMSELSENPALELLDERRCPSCRRRLKSQARCPICSQTTNSDEPIVYLSPRESYYGRGTRYAGEEDLPDLEPAAPEDLSLYVLGQLAADLREDERALAAYILASLDDDGFLTDPAAYIAQATRAPLPKVKHVLGMIHKADPPGLATTGPQECLIVQLENIADDCSLHHTADQILRNHYKQMGHKDVDGIAKSLDVTESKVRGAIQFIQENLNPYPARAYWGSGRQNAPADPNVFHRPDIIISRNPAEPDGPLLVEILSAVSGFLRVNPMFKKAKPKHEGDEEISEAWAKHLERASLFVKCMQQRNNTMRQMMRILVAEQRQFILEGDRYLIPMTRAALADEIGVHESTISRAVANKAVALPGGRIIPLSQFFDRSLSVRDHIKEIIRNEKTPLTDDQIAAKLEKEGIIIARRTVAKYRSMEGILSARLRKKQKANKKPVRF
jgi:RNA polymerase sigma-54 factor